LTLAELAARVDGTVRGDATVVIDDIASIEDVMPGSLTFAVDERYLRAALASRAAAVMTEPAVAGAIDAVAAVARAKNIALTGEPSQGAVIEADRAAVEKVLATLLRNALKFTPSGGRIVLRARRAAGGLNFTVEDTGVGIAEAILKRIGRPFEQNEAALEDGMKGSGLGLAIARSLVELHGGVLRIRSTVGSGTTVMVHLPRSSTEDGSVRVANLR